MAETHKKKILLLTLVHPDFLPPVYAVAQSLRDEGYFAHILTFDSFVPADLELGDNIVVESVGKHHGIGTFERLKLRRQYTSRAGQIAGEQPVAIVAFCAFTFLAGLKIRKNIPLAYHALEVADFILPVFMKSPLSNINNLLAIKKMHRAGFVSTPSIQRSAWVAGRSHLNFLPHTILNTSWLPGTEPDRDYDTYKRILRPNLADKKIILYTGAVRPHLCTLELVQAFEMANDAGSALVMTGIKDNDYCNEIKALVAKSKCADRIQLLPFVTRTEMLALQANADIGVALAREYEDNVESKMMAPNKVGEYLAKGLYLLGVKSEYLIPIGMKGIAALAETPTPADICVAIKMALKAVDDKTYKQTIKDFVQHYFCMQVQVRPLVRWIREHSNSERGQARGNK